jgi:legumain
LHVTLSLNYPSQFFNKFLVASSIFIAHSFMAVNHSVFLLLLSKNMFSNFLSWLPWMLLLLSLHGSVARQNSFEWEQVIRLPGEPDEPVDADVDEIGGTRWAVLIAGSSGYGNYRHQVSTKNSLIIIISLINFT